jgi:hypothetical protein
VVISGGSNAGKGAGMRFEDCSLAWRRSTVVGNRTQQLGQGGGLFFHGGSGQSLAIANSTFGSNFAGLSGGGIHVWRPGNSVPPATVKDTLFEDNHAEESVPCTLVEVSGGGAIYTTLNIMDVEGATFRNNQTNCAGGAILQSFAGILRIRNSVFIGNRSVSVNYHSTNDDGSGGAIYTYGRGTLVVESSLVAGNHADRDGGGVSDAIGGKLIGVTLVGNTARRGGGVFATPKTGVITTTIINSIVTDNFAGGGSGDNIKPNNPIDVVISHSLVQGSNGSGAGWNSALGVDLGGNIDVVPGFQNVVPGDPAASNYRLQLGSPTIDAGDIAAVTYSYDLDGKPRVFNSVVDMGAYESHLLCPAAGAPRLYVDATASGTGLGDSWANALPRLQDALTLARKCPNNSIVAVWVAQGTYYPDDGDYQTDGDRAAAFQLKNGLSLYGGFQGTETALSQRNPWGYITVLSGDIDQDDKTDAHDLVETPADIVGANSYHVVLGSGNNSSAVLDGFAVTGGQGNGSPTVRQHEGGGFFAEGGSPTLNNLTFVGNIAAEGGAMALVGGSNPAISNAWFGGNAASDYGGALHNESSNPTLANVQMSGNRAAAGGGAIYNLASSPDLVNVTIAGNAAGGTVVRASESPRALDIAPVGGGIFNLTGSKPDIRNSIIWANQDSTGVGTPSASMRNLDIGSTPSADYSDIQGLAAIGGLIYDATSIDAGFLTAATAQSRLAGHRCGQ